jgi:DNA-binding response OmpR family regulator
VKERILFIGEVILNDRILALEASGLEVIIARDYPQGLKRLDEISPHLVIVDERLPEINGWEACSRIRQISAIPIILLGAERSGQAVAKAIDCGADAYMFKPLNTHELEARVRALLRRSKREIAPVMAGAEREQGPLLDLIDKVTDKETSLNVNMEDVGGRLFGRSLRLMGRVKVSLGTLKSPS